jgi:hypothetical protein
MAFAVLLLLLVGNRPALAQQLEPRAYSPAPVDLNIAGVAAYYTTGNTLTDPTSPIQNVHSRIYTAMPYYGRTFGLFGRQASVTVAIPVTDAEMTGDLVGVGKSIDRTGLMDPQLRFAMNLLGGPAMTREEYRQHKPETTLGASMLVSVPSGQYDRNKLINLGTNRWACKPEFGLSHPEGKWSFEASAGVWLFEANDEYYGGKVRRQDPLAAYQAHIVYELKPHFWASADYTYYTGGETTVNGVPQNDRQDNSRGGVTVSYPLGPAQSIKLAWSRGVTARIGSNFDTFGAAWQVAWF